MNEPFADRVRRCQRGLADRGAGALIASPGPALTYLTGVEESPSERHFLAIVPRDGLPVVVAPAMYRAELEAAPVDRIVLWDDGDDPVEALTSAFEIVGLEPGTGTDETILLDDRLWTTFAQDVRGLFPDATYDLASQVLEPLRLRKDRTERAALRRAGDLADRVSTTLRERGEEVVGLTERDLADEIDRLLEAEGGRGPAFDTIVAAGENGARPHHQPGDRSIEAGDPVVLDFGAFVDADLESGQARYPGDQTRTLVFTSDPPEGYREVHETVARAQRAAIEHVEPGVTAESVDAVAREIITDAGYGDAFVHRTGHGVGLEVHEPPYVVEGNDQALEPGMVFSVEPGIYLDSEFGVRLEDLVVVTEDGCERLNATPLGWACESDRR
ncbi:aminopeptidase P family protein [Natronosalvus halobius]|uniref:aminopeptidase P family protein n=1 Tax=Natronosalvus halobius TaxID=2953746 RepID=UPI00209F1D4E|nr:Xaa-Pro peptidase family protein [Natronosalvus halobius]USZ72155.1 Xaa-Pro peptidase family protein [Natronosalvus halobius]